MKKTICMLGMIAYASFFVALGMDRDTPEIEGVRLTVPAGENLPAGVLAGIGTNGLAYAATQAKSVHAVGRVERAALTGEPVTLKRGVFLFDAPQLVSSADIGKTVYMVSGNAVTFSTGEGTNVAGVVWQATGGSNAWVRVGY